MQKHNRPQPAFTGATSHPIYKELTHVLPHCPRQAAALFQTYLDLKYAAEWQEVRAFSVSCAINAANGRKGGGGEEEGSKTYALIRGKKKEQKKAEYVVPFSLADVMQTEDFTAIFSALASEELTQEGETEAAIDHILLAAASSQDGTVVYYNVHKGLVKPVN